MRFDDILRIDFSHSLRSFKYNTVENSGPVWKHILMKDFRTLTPSPSWYNVKFILAGAFAAYYWAFNKSDEIPSFPVATSTHRAFRYHAWSIAFESLILQGKVRKSQTEITSIPEHLIRNSINLPLLAIFRVIRFDIETVYEKCKMYTDNAFAKAIMWTCRCCFWMLEKFMRFLNTNAYIMIAVHGQSFLPAAKEAFFLLLRNVVRVAV
uniref:Choline transporter-like protein n=1 Tax=Tetranychus urticae TaxID=32264 RepID=T1KMQ2_TETUR